MSGEMLDMAATESIRNRRGEQGEGCYEAAREKIILEKQFCVRARKKNGLRDTACPALSREQKYFQKCVLRANRAALFFCARRLRARDRLRVA